MPVSAVPSGPKQKIRSPHAVCLQAIEGGGGILVYGGTVAIYRCSFSMNAAVQLLFWTAFFFVYRPVKKCCMQSKGGGVSIVHLLTLAYTLATISDCVFSNNHATKSAGGGLHTQVDESLALWPPFFY